jgi:hypothetical protein
MQMLPYAHAHLGTLGWISLLIYGVSMRTFREITGVRSRFAWVHIVAGSLGVAGALLLAFGAGWAGVMAIAIAASAYAFDTGDLIVRATNRQRQPQAFIAASILWSLVALVLGCGLLLGKPWQSAYVFVLLAGWAGQMINAHQHAIARLDSRLSWYALASFQAAIAIVAVALASADAGLAARGAVFGFAAWIAMSANLMIAQLHSRSTA